jgi:hypothetical protein
MVAKTSAHPPGKSLSISLYEREKVRIAPKVKWKETHIVLVESFFVRTGLKTCPYIWTCCSHVERLPHGTRIVKSLSISLYEREKPIRKNTSVSLDRPCVTGYNL